MDRHARPFTLCWLGAIALVLAGCGTAGLKRALSGEDKEARTYDVPVVGDHTDVANTAPIKLGGVGLVEGLEGTGGDCRADEYRAMLVDDLKKAGLKDINKYLASTECAMVIVEAELPPGAARGATIDLEVKLPPGSKATSIRGGRLRRCALYSYNFAKNLQASYSGPRGMLRGDRMAVAEGPVLMMSGSRGDEIGGLGRVWAGGRALKEYPLALVMGSKSQRAGLTTAVSNRINELFMPGGTPSRDNCIAHTGNNTLVSLRVPGQYKNNLARYLRVVRFIPLTQQGEDARPAGGKAAPSYRQRLAQDVLDPAHCVEAALRLEALGPKLATPALQAGLDSKQPLVRFCCAESLAYLGSPACADELGLAARQPLYRAFALAALASLPEAACTSQLHQLMESDLDDETRYGAFRALHALDPRGEGVAGVNLGGFTLHRVGPGVRPLVHLATTKRAEVVLFGDSQKLVPPFALLAGEFTLKAAPGDGGCTISRTPRVGEPEHCQSTLELEDVIRHMAEMGAHYADVVALAQQAARSAALSCQMRFDALPRIHDIDELVEAGRGNADAH
jgi:hypothetical protein